MRREGEKELSMEIFHRCSWNDGSMPWKAVSLEKYHCSEVFSAVRTEFVEYISVVGARKIECQSFNPWRDR